METTSWWQSFQKLSTALSEHTVLSPQFAEKIQSSRRLFALYNEQHQQFQEIPRQDLNTLIKNTASLIKEIHFRQEKVQQKSTRVFYLNFATSVELGLKEISQSLVAASAQKRGASKAMVATRSHRPPPDSANAYGETLYEQKRTYIQVMEAGHQQKAVKGLKDTAADEADRLASFLDVSEHWLKNRYALEYANQILQENLREKEMQIDKAPLPLMFRLERNQPSYTVRLIKASLKTPTSDDISILDVINQCYGIPMAKRDGNILIEDSEVIRFVRLHSEKDNLLVFKTDRLSQIAAEMYHCLVQIITGITRLVETIVELINQTPIQELEYAFMDINPEECRTLLRYKFQSMLPGINEDHYRASQTKQVKERSVRTIETIEEYDRKFQNCKKTVLGNLKSTLAVSYWLRKTLTAVIRNNQILEKKSEAVKSQDDGKNGEKTETEKQAATQEKSKWLKVGISLTIGDEDISIFYINPDDVITSQMSLQRADRADKWIAVRKSEKLHRLLKRDFMRVIDEFVTMDLNRALKKYHFREVDLHGRLLPEINERLGDVKRVELIRSGILGTTITNLEEFWESKQFHATIRRYFHKPDWDNVHYPKWEKYSQVSRDIALSSTAILQMKYRRVLRVDEEIHEQAKRLKVAISQTVIEEQKKELEHQYLLTVNLGKIINQIKKIMLFAKPSLKDVTLEPDSDYVVVGESD